MVNKELYSQIYRERKRLGYESRRYSFFLNRFLGENGFIEGHEYIGKILLNKETGKRYLVDKVCLHWYNGWYYVLTAYNYERSHTTLTFANLNSQESWVIDGAKEFESGFEFVQMNQKDRVFFFDNDSSPYMLLHELEDKTLPLVKELYENRNKAIMNSNKKVGGLVEVFEWNEVLHKYNKIY